MTCPTNRRWWQGVAATLVLSVTAAVSATDAGAGRQSLAKPGYPENPAAPDSVWPSGHGAYCQQSTALTSLREDDDITLDVGRFTPTSTGVLPTGTILTAPYPNGDYAFWGAHGTDVWKAAAGPGGMTLRYAPRLAAGQVSPSGYWVMRRDGTVVVPDLLRRVLHVYADTDPTDAGSPIRHVRTVPLPAELYASGSAETVLGIKLLHSGVVVVTTTRGAIAVLDKDLRSKHVSRFDGERFENNPCVDGEDNVYVTTDAALRKLHWDGQRLTEVWATPIAFSGSTPTLMGGPGDQDRLVAITVAPGSDALSKLAGEGSTDRPSSLLLLWRDEIPADWAGLPGEDRRVAARHPITFDLPAGDPATEPTQNSLLVEGNDVVLAAWDGTSLAYHDLIGRPRGGVEKVSWNPATRRVERRWLNRSLVLPNSMQAMSTGSDRMYALGLSPGAQFGQGQWGLHIVDWTTGEAKRFVPAGSRLDPTYNIVGSGLQIGADGEVITMSPLAALRFRRTG